MRRELSFYKNVREFSSICLKKNLKWDLVHEVSQIVAYQRGCWCWDWTSLLWHYFAYPKFAHRSELRNLQYPKTLDGLKTSIAPVRSGLPYRSPETGPIAFQRPYHHDEHRQTHTVPALFPRNHANPDLAASPAIQWLTVVQWYKNMCRMYICREHSFTGLGLIMYAAAIALHQK